MLNNYKKIILFTALIILLAGCNQKPEETVHFKSPLPKAEKQTLPEKTEKPTPPSPSPGYEKVIETCDSLCNVDSEAYCLKKRTISVKGAALTGTCRSFSRKNSIPGFNKCEGFCKKYGEVEK